MEGEVVACSVHVGRHVICARLHGRRARRGVSQAEGHARRLERAARRFFSMRTIAESSSCPRPSLARRFGRSDRAAHLPPGGRFFRKIENPLPSTRRCWGVRVQRWREVRMFTDRRAA